MRSIFSESLILSCQGNAPVQALPELEIVTAVCIFRANKDSMVLADQFSRWVSE